MIIYQYRGVLDTDGLRYLMDLFLKGQMKFTEPANFNDPLDCYPTMSYKSSQKIQLLAGNALRANRSASSD